MKSKTTVNGTFSLNTMALLSTLVVATPCRGTSSPACRPHFISIPPNILSFVYTFPVLLWKRNIVIDVRVQL